MFWRMLCVLMAGTIHVVKPMSSQVKDFPNPYCGRVHCQGDSLYCCTDSSGELACCYKSIYHEYWFWVVLVIGLLLIAALLFCSCRQIYRYHNASQYTKLRLQQSQGYGSVMSRTVASINMPPPPISYSSNDSDCGQLPSYADVMQMPPSYDETNTER